ncbi:MAG: DUF3492 domain-containing protein, partial [Rickettsiales bacterium]|nr:DUF3492 domain-containing protein [Rickettsiales bacterium]
MEFGNPNERADVCLFLEGTYPYVPGGVSGWTHDLIREQSHLKFHIVALLPPDAKLKLRYDLPPNVISMTNVFLQRLPKGRHALPTQRDASVLFSVVEQALHELHTNPHISALKHLLDAFGAHKNLGSRVLLDSVDAWNMLLSIYNRTMEDCAFLDFFWSWRALLG